MKKLVLMGALALGLMSFSNAPGNPSSCWDAADAAEVYVCGSVGCNYGLWVAVYDACMGAPKQ